MIPQSHLDFPPQAEAALKVAKRRMWSFGRIWDDDVFSSPPMEIPLTVGQAVLFDLWLVHGAAPMSGGTSRLALAMKYVAPDASRMGGWRRGTLLCGSVQRGPLQLLDGPTAEVCVEESVRITKDAAVAYREFNLQQWVKLQKAKR